MADRQNKQADTQREKETESHKKKRRQSIKKESTGLRNKLLCKHSLGQFLGLSALGLESPDVDLPVSHSGAVGLYQGWDIHTTQRHPLSEHLPGLPQSMEQLFCLQGESDRKQMKD